ncbi:hypothetical protein AB1Y20_005519 [Prymnesium parvum]|uniref:Uncharacterized protein n=1 Tax=Prymnesium parvum TaxID=97485 RepID=A0AB34J7G5_PRYPA
MVRRVLVTGANKGIGLAIARRVLLEHADTHVVVGSRDTARGQQAIDSLLSEGGAAWKDRLLLLQIDTASESSVSRAASTLAEAFGSDPPPLYAIVNNAGVAAGSVKEIFEVNVRGPRRVDTNFLPLLDPKAGRIVQMSSGVSAGCVSRSSPRRQETFMDPSITWNQIEEIMQEVEGYPNGAKDLEANGFGVQAGAYGLSKALLNAYTVMLAREHPNIKVNSCSPGMIATDLMGSFLPWYVPVPTSFLRVIASRVMHAKTPHEGATSTMHLLFNDLKGNGRYYGSDAKRSPMDTARSPGTPEYEGP